MKLSYCENMLDAIKYGNFTVVGKNNSIRMRLDIIPEVGYGESVEVKRCPFCDAGKDCLKD